jgi:hypothetical protein
MSHDAYSPPAAPTIPQAPAPTAVNSVTPAAIASVASASPEPIYIEDDIRGLASWNLDCVTIGRPELSEHAPAQLSIVLMQRLRTWYQLPSLIANRPLSLKIAWWATHRPWVR